MHHGSAAPAAVKKWNNRWNKHAEPWHTVKAGKGNSFYYAQQAAAEQTGVWVFKGGAPPPKGYGKGKGNGMEIAAWDKGKGKGKDADAKGKGKSKGKEQEQPGTKGLKGKDLTLKGGAGKGKAPPGA